MRFLTSLKRYRIFHVWASALLLLAGSTSSGAITVHGTVTNKTTNLPDANDEIVLVALTQNMQEVAHTKTDANGRYSIDLPDPGMHLIRVDHQNAAYFAAVAPGTTKVDVTVYDVAPVVKGVATEAVMVRVEADEQGLHVIESYFAKNESSPPRTQFGPKAYEIYLPAAAQIEASIAMGPGGMPVSSSPVPLGEKGHYSFIFPVRPGETRFQVTYRLPYNGSLVFQPRVALPTSNYAVVLPKSMLFSTSGGTSFEPMNGDIGTQSFLAKNLSPSKTVSFTLSGKGALPRDNLSGQSPADKGTASVPVAQDTRPGGGMAPPKDTPDPLNKYKWWLISGLGLVLAIGTGFFLRSSRPANHSSGLATTGTSSSIAMTSPQNLWLTALKNQLFALETERIGGHITDGEYGEQKAAFEILLKRALALPQTTMQSMASPQTYNTTPNISSRENHP